MSKGASALLPPSGVKYPLHVSESCIRKANSAKSRAVVALSFAHRPDRLDLTRPGTLSSHSAGAADRVGLNFHCTPGTAMAADGVELSGTRKPVTKSQARDYILVFANNAWYLEPVSDSVTGIKPVPNGSSSTLAPNVPSDYCAPSDLDDPDAWNAPGSGVAPRTQSNGPIKGRPLPSSPAKRSSSSLRTAQVNGPSRSVTGTRPSSVANGVISASEKPTFPSTSGGADVMSPEEEAAAYSEALAMDDDDDEADTSIGQQIVDMDDHEMIIESAVEENADNCAELPIANGRPTVGTKGQKSLAGAERRSRASDSSDSDSGSESGDSSTSSSESSSSGSSSSDSVEYTDESGDSDSE